MRKELSLIDRISHQRWTFLTIFIFLVLYSLFPMILRSNEAVTLTYAKHYINNNWIPNDLFMNQNPGYTFLFSFIAGSLARVLPLAVVSIIIRILALLGFSYLLHQIADTFNVKFFIIIIFMFAFLPNQSIVAGEWMIILIESKPFAYLFALLAVIYFIRKNYSKTFIFLGLSVSFHILIGIYASLSLLLTYLLNISYLKSEFPRLLKKLYLFFIFGSLGIFAVIQNFFTKYDINRVWLGRTIVTIREAHHELPLTWGDGRNWIPGLVLCLGILCFTFFIVKDRKYKILSSFGLSSFIFFVIGFIIYWSNKWHLLKFFWFRFPDTILPFVSFFCFFSLLFCYLGKIKFIRNRQVLTKSITFLFLLISISAVAYSVKRMVKYVKPIIADTRYFYLKDTEEEMTDVMLWISKNTDESSVFLVNPFIDNFYVGAERGAFVLYKAGPFTEEKYAEWYERLKICNGNKELTQYSKKNRQEVEQSFYALSQEEIQRINERYGMDYYVGLEGRALQLPVVYNNEKYAIYSLN